MAEICQTAMSDGDRTQKEAYDISTSRNLTRVITGIIRQNHNVILLVVEVTCQA
jgi:hypothetical protein